MSEKLEKLTLLVILFPTLVHFCVGQNAQRAFITEERVAQAITSTGIPVLPAQIEFLSEFRATTADAALQVVAISPASSRGARVQLRCQDRRECLPFYVLVHGMEGSNGSKARLQLASLNGQTQNTLSTELVHGGDHATLILEAADSRIRMPVICLQSGLRGETIRVRSNDGKRIYRAEVVRANLLKGSL
jgi:hypothetical protein